MADAGCSACPGPAAAADAVCGKEAGSCQAALKQQLLRDLSLQLASRVREAAALSEEEIAAACRDMVAILASELDEEGMAAPALEKKTALAEALHIDDVAGLTFASVANPWLCARLLSSVASVEAGGEAGAARQAELEAAAAEAASLLVAEAVGGGAAGGDASRKAALLTVLGIEDVHAAVGDELAMLAAGAPVERLPLSLDKVVEVMRDQFAAMLQLIEPASRQGIAEGLPFGIALAKFFTREQLMAKAEVRARHGVTLPLFERCYKAYIEDERLQQAMIPLVETHEQAMAAAAAKHAAALSSATKPAVGVEELLSVMHAIYQARATVVADISRRGIEASLSFDDCMTTSFMEMDSKMKEEVCREHGMTADSLQHALAFYSSDERFAASMNRIGEEYTAALRAISAAHAAALR